jgi:hypothetical protein
MVGTDVEKGSDSTVEGAAAKVGVANERRHDFEPRGFICCFCGKPIRPNPPDPCTLVLTTNESEGASQDLFCHALCLKAKLASNLPTLLDAY